MSVREFMRTETSGDHEQFYGSLYNKSDELMAEIEVDYGQVVSLNIWEPISPAKLKQFIYQVTKSPDVKGYML